MFNKQNLSLRPLAAVLLIAIASSLGVAQDAKKSPVQERDVRAGMNFLASDAMQGRGSGTQFERIAAEYIGSQFMQFGLEPVGEPGADGRPSYVQTVSNSRNSLTAPTLKFGTRTFELGKEMVVMRANATKLSGSFRRGSLTEKPAGGSAVFVSLGDGGTGQNLNQSLQTVTSGDASIVIVEETAQARAGWDAMAARAVTWASPAAKPSAVVIVSKQAAAEIAGLPAGTKIEFSSTPGPVQTRNTWNAIGKIPGSDPKLAADVILITSHLDHLGVRENTPGDDKIFNGADDDASGSVAVLGMARVLAQGKKRPKRSVYFVCFGSEESGGLGAGYFVNNLPFPKERLIANLEFEMIGRPDSKVKPEELWLTGYERSNLGPELARRGAKLVQDPHPDQNFFQRSDNYTLARQGVIAHTVSSFGLHTDYHKASDEVKTIDFTHMTRAINSMVEPVRWLVNSDFVPAWNEGKKP
jgi:aminopeptidase YwaD